MLYRDIHFETRHLHLTNGCQVAYIDEGDGDTTLLFVHGLATFARSWMLNIQELKQRYRCVAVDLPGNGYSEGGDYPYGMNFFAGCVYDFARKMGLQNVVPIGHSMGGQVVLTLLINEPTICRKAVLCAAAGFETFTPMERAIYKAGIHFLDFFSTEENSLTRVLKASFFSYPAYADDMISELVGLLKHQPVSQYRRMIEGCIDGMINEPVFDRLHTIQQEVLVLCGERDALIPNRLLHPTTAKAIAEEGVARMPGARLEVLAKCGHFLQFEQPAKVNWLISEFIG